MSVLTVEQAAVFRGETLVLRDVSLGIPAGGALVLSGPNGSGKSTLLRLLAGLVRPASGRVAWNGEDVFADLTLHAARVAYLGHQDAIKLGLTAAENLHFAAAISHRPVADALAAMRLDHLAEVPARMLSAGQKRRLALARLTLSRGTLWLLDEPTLGLDTASVACFGEVLMRHRAAGGMVAAATHVPLPMADAVEFRLT
jgi:heme exporter protein A